MKHEKIDEKSARELKVLKMASEVVIFGEGKGRLGELGKILNLGGGPPASRQECTFVIIACRNSRMTWLNINESMIDLSIRAIFPVICI